MQFLEKYKWLCQQPDGEVFICTLKPNNVGGRWRDKGEFKQVPLVPQFGDSLYAITSKGIERYLPDLKVDAPVIVFDEYGTAKNRHFSHFGETSGIFVFPDGRTSWSATASATILFKNWRLPD